jgi:hypothetical protein
MLTLVARLRIQLLRFGYGIRLTTKLRYSVLRMKIVLQVIQVFRLQLKLPDGQF